MERDRLFGALAGVPYLQPYPSHSNFVLCKVTGRDARDLRDKLATEHGIMVRHYDTPLLKGFIRVSVGKPEHTDALMTALETV
jgi:histidinol-phosphate aminotransferase